MLKLSYDSKDSIPEGLKEHYKEQDGGFVLQLEGDIKTQEDVDRAMKAMEKQKDLRIEAEKELAQYKDVDLEKWDQVKDIDPDNIPKAADPNDEKEFQKAVSEAVREKEKELKSDFRKREEELQDQVQGVEAKFKNNHLQQWKRNMLAEKFGFTDLDDLDTFLLKVEHSDLSDYRDIKRTLKTLEVVDEDGKLQIVGGELKDTKGAEEVLQKVAKYEVAKNYRPAPNTSGGGANNNGSVNGVNENPYKKGDTFNVTKQGILEREDPERAKALAAAAGIDIN